MTAQGRGQTRPVAPACHELPESVAPVSPGVARAGQRRASGSALGVVLALPRWARVLGAAAVVLGALLAVGVPLASLAPLLAIGGCLGMHLFMGHGVNHGGGHAAHRETQAGGDRELQARDGGEPR